MKGCSLLLPGCLLLAGCGRYADFSLPVLSGGDPNLSFVFQAEPAPVLSRGADWDSHDVLNPSVTAAPWRMFYSGFDGRTWRTGMATSDDGAHWSDAGAVLSPGSATWEGSYIAANGAALFHSGQVWYWYQAGARGHFRIGLARSGDGRAFHKEPSPVLEPGPYMSWDERVAADPYVIRIEPWFYLFYLGQDRAEPPRQRLGLARSADGIHWEKLRSNPILEPGEPGGFDERGAGEPAVWAFRGFYWMLYTGRDAGEHRRLGLARSTDGVHWTKLPAIFAGSQPWDSAVMCDPAVVVNGDEVRVWFGGGDLPSPDENLHGQIGYGTLRPVNATLAK